MTTSKVKNILRGAVALIVLLLLSTMVVSLYSIYKLRKDLQTQVHTRTVIVTLKDNLVDLLNLETGARGFMVTADSTFLEPYYNALGAISVTTDSLRKLTRDNDVQQKKLDTLERLIKRRAALLAIAIQLKQQGKEKELKEIPVRSGKIVMDSIRAVNRAMLKVEEDMFQERRNDTAESISRAETIFVIEGILSLVAVLLLGSFVFAQLNKRTRAEEILRAANNDLERSNNELTSFAYVASHDLREPLRKIQVFSKLITDREKTLSDKSMSYMERINAAAQRMDTLVEDLFNLSVLSASDAIFETTDLSVILHEVLTYLDDTVREKNAVVEADKLPVLRAVPVQMHQVFLNLVGNALKYSKPGVSPHIRITVAKVAAEQVPVKGIKAEAYWNISIRDNGIGFEQEYVHKIFRIFERLHGKGEFEGTGIGLAIVKKIIENHNGAISATGKPGVGSTFTFFLPDA